jgi:hypothetical protein
MLPLGIDSRPAVTGRAVLEGNPHPAAGPSTLDRLIGEQRRKAREHIFERIADSLPAEIVGQLDDLLQAGESKRSGLHAIKESPGVPCPAKEIERVLSECCPETEGIDITLLEHVSPTSGTTCCSRGNTSSTGA